MTGNVQLYLAEAGWAVTRMAAPLGGIGSGVKVGREMSERCPFRSFTSVVEVSDSRLNVCGDPRLEAVGRHSRGPKDNPNFIGHRDRCVPIWNSPRRSFAMQSEHAAIVVLCMNLAPTHARATS